MKKNLSSKIFSERTYQNLQAYPLMILLGLSFVFILFLGIIWFFISMGLYVIFIMILKFGKISYEQKYKVYRYIKAIIYDIDWHKPIEAWIVLNISETYPLEIGNKDLVRQKLREIKQKIEENKRKREELTKILIKLEEQKFEREKKKDKKRKELKEEKKEKEKPYEDEDELFDEDSDLEGYDTFLDEAEEEKKKKIQKPRETAPEEEKMKIEEKQEREILKLNVLKLQKQIARYDTIIDDLMIEYEETEQSHEKFDQSLNKVKTTYNLNEGWNFYKSRIMYSDVYSSDDLILILPDSFDATFNFTDDFGNFAGVYLRVPTHAIATFIEVENFKNTPYLMCVFSNWYVKNNQLTSIKKEIAETLTINAQIRHLADEVSQIQNEFKTLKFDNMDYQNQAKILLNQLKRQEKRHKVVTKSLLKEQKVSWDMPPRRLYGIVILLSILAGLGWVLFLFAPLIFNYYTIPASSPTP